MPLNIFADFFNFINIPLFYSFSTLLIISFIVWELPRSIKLMDPEYTKGLYPEGGRIPDFFLLAIGLLCMGFFMFGSNSQRIIAFLRTPGITALYIILMVVVPLIIILGYFKRFFGRMDHHDSVTVFLVHGFLDLAHTAFFVSLSILAIPIIGFLIGLH